jgi:hypothetical protein
MVTKKPYGWKRSFRGDFQLTKIGNQADNNNCGTDEILRVTGAVLGLCNR